jgi:tRNA-splicing ligase RtcB
MVEHITPTANPAIATIDVPGTTGPPITVIGTPVIRAAFDPKCLEQAINTRSAPGVDSIVINPDAHAGYGAPIGCVLASRTHVYPGPIGVDIKCSMSLLQLDIPAAQIADKPIRRKLINALCDRIPTGPGKGARSVPRGKVFSDDVGKAAAIGGATRAVCESLGIPASWVERCEDASHCGHDGTSESLAARLQLLVDSGVIKNLSDKLHQLGSYGGGNHFGECSVVSVVENQRARSVAQAFGLRDGNVAFLSHCGSRGLGNALARNQFSLLADLFAQRGIPLPGGDRELVYAQLGTPEANNYLDDMALGANFATVNHLVINALVCEAFQEVFPGCSGDLVYCISHNIARVEPGEGGATWVHRKGATRAFPAGHPSLMGTRYEATGHPILLPGNPRDGSVVMVAEQGAKVSCYSVNHGAGRALGRRAASRTLDQNAVDTELDRLDILSNCRQYPLDEAPDAYKDFHEVLKSVEVAGLATAIARLKTRFVLKDSAQPDER